MGQRYVVNPNLAWKKVSDRCEFDLPYFGISAHASLSLLEILDFFQSPQSIDDAIATLNLSCSVTDWIKDRFLIVKEVDATTLAGGLVLPAINPIGLAVDPWDLNSDCSGNTCVIGAPIDFAQIGYRSPAIGPEEIRNTVSFGDSEGVLDLGNIVHDSSDNIFRIGKRISIACKAAFESGCAPVLLGGDHSMSLFAIKAARKRYTSLGLIHFDAHLDRNDLWLADAVKAPISHANFLSHLIEDDSPDALVHIGIRDRRVLVTSTESTEAALPILNLTARDVVTGRTRELQAFLKRAQHWYISLDLDVLDPSVAPEVTTPRIGGLSLHELTNILEEIGVSVVAFDLMEVCHGNSEYNRAAHSAGALLAWFVHKYSGKNV